MKKMNKDGLILCNLQGKIFEESIKAMDCSSPIFIRRYMNSVFCESMDHQIYLNVVMDENQAISLIGEELGELTYGQVKFSKESMFWMGYIYRYWVYCYETSSKSVFKIIQGRELEKLYIPYHSLAPDSAIERILESNNVKLNLSEDEIVAKGVTILRELKKNQ